MKVEIVSINYSKTVEGVYKYNCIFFCTSYNKKAFNIVLEDGNNTIESTRTFTLSGGLFMQSHMPGWFCQTYAYQNIINIVVKVEADELINMYSSNLSPAMTSEYNGLYNLPLFEVGTDVDNAKETPPLMIACSVGDDLSVAEGWHFIDPATKQVVTSGSFFMKAERDNNFQT